MQEAAVKEQHRPSDSFMRQNAFSAPVTDGPTVVVLQNFCLVCLWLTSNLCRNELRQRLFDFDEAAGPAAMISVTVDLQLNGCCRASAGSSLRLVLKIRQFSLPFAKNLFDKSVIIRVNFTHSLDKLLVQH